MHQNIVPKSNNSLQASYYPAFDYLRFSLAVGVALSHTALIPWPDAGNFCVQVFFSLSGWLIGGILLSSVDLPRFYYNRAARIWVPYFLALGALVIASLLKNDHVGPKWLEFVFYKLSFVYNLFGPQQLDDHRIEMPLQGTGNHFWSICAEEQFYLIAPILISFTPWGRRPFVWGLLSTITLFSPLWSNFTAISLGVFCATLESKHAKWHLKSGVRLSVVGVLIGSGALLIYNVDTYRLTGPIIAACIVLLLAIPGAPSRVSIFLGGVSYELYLNHWIAGFVTNAIFKMFSARGTLLAQITSVLLGLLLAAFLYWTVDRTIRLQRNRFYSREAGRRIAIMAFTLVTLGLTGGLMLAM